MSSPCRWALAAGVAAAVLIVLPHESLASHVDASGNKLPHATVKVWDGLANGLGSRPNAAVADTAGITGHVATSDAPLTIVNVYRQTGTNPYQCGAVAAGLVFWNPATNVFKCYAVAGGQPAAIDVNRSTGDTWVSNPTNGDAATGQLWVNLQGTDNFRGYVFGIGPGIWGVLVDPATGHVWFTQRLAGKISRLDPATGSVTSWTIGGRPQRLARDSAGRLYATVQAASADQIVRLDPATTTNNVTRWTVPGALSLADDGERMADGIAIDADGGVWFSETLSASQAVAIARLGPGPDGVLGTADDEITEFTKPGLSEPLATATVGSDASGDFHARTLQVFATEGSGNAVTVVTGREAVGTVTAAPASASTVLQAAEAPLVKSFSRTPLIATIVPATAVVDGLDGAADLVGDTKTAGPDGIPGDADDERIPGILRFPFGTIGAFPSGMTEVIGGNRVYGTFRDSGKLFELTSGAVIAAPPPPSANNPPLAQCANRTVLANDQCQGAASINNGSSDPDGDPITVTQSPQSFTGIGPHDATLTVTDDQGASAQCTATVSVVDITPPSMTCPDPQAVECTGNLSASATLSPAASDNCGLGSTICSPVSGASFALGQTSVTCAATDTSGNASTCTTTVTVVDTRQPTVTCDPAQTVECTNRAGTATVRATATDACDPNVAATCQTPAGGSYPLGATSVSCSATDAAGNSGSCTTTVAVVDTKAPAITCEGPQGPIECTGHRSATATVSATAVDQCDGTVAAACTTPAGGSYPVGSTAVLCRAQDAASNTSECSVTVVVQDTQPPAVSCPAPITVECANRSGVATVISTATDICDGSVASACTPGDGVYPVGTTAVTCSARDAASNAGSCATTVTVVDTLAPSISCSAPVTVECVNRSGSASVGATATDQCDGVVPASCATPAVYGLGATPVVCSATDAAGHTGNCSTTVQVVDTVPPSVTCVPSVNPSGKHVPAAHGPNQDGFYRVGASDLCSASGGIVIALGSTMLANGETIKITQSPGASGVRLVNTMGPRAIKHFRVGPGDAVVMAQDASGNRASAGCPVPPQTRDEREDDEDDEGEKEGRDGKHGKDKRDE